MSRGERKTFRYVFLSPIPQYGVDYGLGVGGFWKAKPYKERADFYAC